MGHGILFGQSDTVFPPAVVLVEALWTGQTNTSPEETAAAGGTNSCLLQRRRNPVGSTCYHQRLAGLLERWRHSEGSVLIWLLSG